MLNTLGRAANMAALAFSLTLAAGGAAVAQDAAEQPGCTTVDGVSVGAGCKSGSTSSPAATVEDGMPATEHQKEVLGTDDKNAAQGQNMEATGAGGAQLPATQHQQDVLQKPGSGEQKETGQ